MYVTFNYQVIFYSTIKPETIGDADQETDDDDSTKVQMDKVISLRTDVRFSIPDYGISCSIILDISTEIL